MRLRTEDHGDGTGKIGKFRSHSPTHHRCDDATTSRTEFGKCSVDLSDFSYGKAND
jgi:hypothetical protein